MPPEGPCPVGPPGMEGGMQETFNRLDTLLDIADTPGERFRRIAGAFTDRVEQVPAGAWSNPAPCDGWTARDIVGHLVGWVPYVIGKAGIEFVRREFDAGPPGRLSVERAIDMLVTGDVLIHTWDLARATGLDERLDAALVHSMFEGMQPLDDILRASGHYGRRGRR